jgi:dihydrofolate synthase/folylpolyglutamate synthase
MTARIDLAGWLAWLEQLHPSAMELGLDRIGRVAARLGVDAPQVPVITVAGTNGKGSVCALAEAILGAGGYRVGCYTSPHLARFNERVRVAGEQVSDARLCTAFSAVDAARGDTRLTFFEFTTLGALAVFRALQVDVLVLEVGLGGRLDATNVVAPDAAVVTSIGVDHAEWLGADRDAIAHEKAGIARRGRPLVSGSTDAPAGLEAAAQASGADLRTRPADFDEEAHTDDWDWHGAGHAYSGLPRPAVMAGYQLENAATALMALAAAGCLPSQKAVATGLRAAHVPGRLERWSGADPETLLDVAHNPDAAAALAQTLAARPAAGRTLAVLGMYHDKDVAGVVAALTEAVDTWVAVGLPPPRGRTANGLAAAMAAADVMPAAEAPDPQSGWRLACARASPGDRIVVLGSFATVAHIKALSL